MSWADGAKVIKRMQRVERLKGKTVHGQEVYRCACGAFHLTSNSYTKKRAS